MPANLTIDDIAEALGVSKTTVSRAISGKGRISKETTERVRAYIEEHNYKPNVYAQGLAKQCTRNIGVIWPSDTEAETLPFFQKCLLGINKVTAREGYDLLLTITSESEDETEALRRIVENHKVDGIILTRTLVRDAAADYLQEAGIPFVSIGNCEDPQRICVDNENELACIALTKRLLDMGIGRLALIGGSLSHVISRTRLRGFQKGFEAAGKAPDPNLIYMGVRRAEEVEQAVLQLMERGAEVIIGMDDRITGEILSVCHRKSIAVPEQLRLASFYDSALLEHAVPAVTSVQFDDAALGAAAAQTLLALLRGEVVESQYLSNYRIQLRETVY